MENHFLRVRDLKALDDLITRSENKPVILFKHSTTCPVSASAYQEMQNISDDVNLVEVQSARTVSEEVEKRTGLRHESPQVIILHRGRPVWSASHWRIKADAVKTALRENGLGWAQEDR